VAVGWLSEAKPTWTMVPNLRRGHGASRLSPRYARYVMGDVGPELMREIAAAVYEAMEGRARTYRPKNLFDRA
jgi:hypothetical protein